MKSRTSMLKTAVRFVGREWSGSITDRLLSLGRAARQPITTDRQGLGKSQVPEKRGDGKSDSSV